MQKKFSSFRCFATRKNFNTIEFLNLNVFEKIFKCLLLRLNYPIFASLFVYIYIQDSIFKKSKRILEYRFLINAKDSYETMKNATKLEIVVHIDGRTIVPSNEIYEKKIEYFGNVVPYVICIECINIKDFIQ